MDCKTKKANGQIAFVAASAAIASGKLTGIFRSFHQCKVCSVHRSECFVEFSRLAGRSLADSVTTISAGIYTAAAQININLTTLGKPVVMQINCPKLFCYGLNTRSLFKIGYAIASHSSNDSASNSDALSQGTSATYFRHVMATNS